MSDHPTAPATPAARIAAIRALLGDRPADYVATYIDPLILGQALWDLTELLADLIQGQESTDD